MGGDSRIQVEGQWLHWNVGKLSTTDGGMEEEEGKRCADKMIYEAFM